MISNRSLADLGHRSAAAFGAVFVVCAITMAIVLYLQHWLNLDPCPWCIVQRIVLLAVGIVSFIAALHRPTGGAIRGYGRAIALLAVSGVAAASYHIYLQSDPERAMKCAGSMVERLLDQLGLGRIAPSLFQYDGPCTLKPWSLFGLSIPEWSLVTFLFLLIVAIRLPRWINR
jgi:protein dithiol:quinone oxidoreductase